MMFVSVIFCMLALAVQMAVVPKAFESRRLWIEKSKIEVDGKVVRFHDFVTLSGQNWTDTNPEAWFQYTSHLYTGMFAKIISQTALMNILEACVDVACQLASCAYLWWALRKWSHFNQCSPRMGLQSFGTFFGHFDSNAAFCRVERIGPSGAHICIRTLYSFGVTH